MLFKKQFSRMIVVYCLNLAVLQPMVRAEEAKKQLPRWSPVSNADYLSIGLLSAGVLGFSAIKPGASPGWTDGFLYDDAARNSLRIGSKAGRDAAASISNIGLDFGMVAPILLDSVGLSWARDGDKQGAWRIAVIDLQALMTAAFLTQSAKVIVTRGRPFLKECATDSGYDEGCNGTDANMSFFSGHTAMAFAGASLICVNHSKLDLFRSAWADRAVCAGAMSIAATTGLLRIASDRHYATDVTVGALVGLFSGLYIPTRFHEVEGTHEAAVQTQFMLLPAGEGALSATEVIRF